MQVHLTSIPEIKSVAPRLYVGARGSQVESYRGTASRDYGIDGVLVQGNQSYSRAADTIRGLHFQIPPFAQARLVRVLRRAAFDVAVDVRLGSPTFGRSDLPGSAPPTGPTTLPPVAGRVPGREAGWGRVLGSWEGRPPGFEGRGAGPVEGRAGGVGRAAGREAGR